MALLGTIKPVLEDVEKDVHWRSRLQIHSHHIVSMLLRLLKDDFLPDIQDIHSSFNRVLTYMAK